MMWLLLATLAFADDVSIDVVDGKVLVDGQEATEDVSGILLSTERYTHYLELEADHKKLTADAQSFDEWKASTKIVWEDALASHKQVCEDGVTKLTTHYDAALITADERTKLAAKRTFGEKHGGPLGFALGAVSVTVVSVGAIYAYGRVFGAVAP